MLVRKTPNWETADEIELDFKKFEIRTVKIFLDAIYGCGSEDANTEDLVKLVALVDQNGSQKERDEIFADNRTDLINLITILEILN